MILYLTFYLRIHTNRYTIIYVQKLLYIEELLMKTAIYARVSTNNGQDPEMQLREVRDYCQRRGWKVNSEYVDTISGAKDSRPELNRLLAEAHRRQFDAVVVWK